MADQFTAPMFSHAWHRWQGAGIEASDPEWDVVEAALRIAAAVMRPGVIEAALPAVSRTHMEPPYDARYLDGKSDRDRDAAAIRKALTDG
jgi:hypothetical protein